MDLISIFMLVLFPLMASLVIFSVRNDGLRNVLGRVFSVITVVLALVVAFQHFKYELVVYIEKEKIIDYFMMSVEILLASYIIFAGIKNKKYLVSIFASIQTPLMIWFELTQKHGIKIHSSIVFDKLSIIMVLIVGLIGGMICLYAVGYMQWYHVHHEGYKERKSFFIGTLFLFISAMFGLILSNNLTWIYFFWEITSFCSFLLIGYTKTKEAENNSYRALAINMGGGLAFAIAIVIIGMNFKTLELSVFAGMKPTAAVLVPVFLLSVAALTKSAQLPFSSWLFGAMAAPTPSSALLHSATMVKAGVYLIIRISPLLGQTSVGRIVTLVGGVTFLSMSLMAISQEDAKKILACSTVANLGLIIMCASISTPESLWAAILLVIFHSVSKSLLFMSVGSVEHQLLSRNVEDMDVLMNVSKSLSLYMLVGIAGMFLAPFGMLISKWVAMKAFIDSKNILSVIIIAYGSAVTLFYWTKWMGKLVSNANRKNDEKHKFFIDEEIPIFIQAVLVVISCFGFPAISKYVLIPYLSRVFFQQGTSMPIATSDVKIMLFMLSMIVILPLSFAPIFKKDNRRIVPVYMAGENTGNNETFNGALGLERKVVLSNWYMKDFFGGKRLSYWSSLACTVILCAEIVFLIGGFAG